MASPSWLATYATRMSTPHTNKGRLMLPSFGPLAKLTWQKGAVKPYGLSIAQMCTTELWGLLLLGHDGLGM
jgi:hypothetical protein